jgi:hypothetical protein
MFKTSAFVAILVAAAFSSPVYAVVADPSLTIGERESATQVRWVCGPIRCVWRPGRGFVPRFAIWGPPRLPGCFYEKRRRVWVEICP